MGRKVSHLRCVSMLALSGAFVAIGGVAQAATPDRGGATAISELVVTAERRVENLQTAAISATVLDEKALAAKGVIGLTTLQFAAPGIEISDFSSANTFNIRGIGQSAQVDIDLPSGVVIYRDQHGVPTPDRLLPRTRPTTTWPRSRCCAGRQGTFVGKSDTSGAGAVLLSARRTRSWGHFGGSKRMAGGGNYGFFENTDIFNVPLSDTLAVRLAIHGEARESLFDSIRTTPIPGDVNAGGPFIGDDLRRLISGRLGILWAPIEAFRAVMKVDAVYLLFGSHATSVSFRSGDWPGSEDIRNPIANGHFNVVMPRYSTRASARR